jgi:ERF superfamily protein
MAAEVPGSLAEALITLQANLPHIRKDDTARVETSSGRSYSYSYVNLSTITEMIFPLLAALGLYWVCQPTLQEGNPDKFVLRYRLVHGPTGEQIGGEYPLPGNANSQSIGGAITYARRYALCAVLGLAPAEDDDDANAAAREAAERQRQRTSTIADERAHTPPASPRLAERLSGRLPDDQWTTGGTR